MRCLFSCFVFISLLALTSCLATYGDTISRSYTLLKTDTSGMVPVNQPIQVFFDGEPINFEYAKIGLVEVKGNQFASTADLLDHLKYEAFKNGGDALIAVKDGYMTRQSGLLFSKTPPTDYSAHIYTGIAVKLKDHHKFNPPNAKEIEYIKKVQSYDADCAKRSSNQFVGSFVLVIVFIGVLIYAVSLK